MRRVLITGMSGTGKSSVVRALVAAGHKAIDADDGWCLPQPDGRQLWNEQAIGRLLATEDAEILFLAGCEQNQAAFYPQLDCIILLSAPLPILAARLAGRDTNGYGKSAEEFARFLADVEQVEPLLRCGADHEIDTTAPLAEVVASVLRLAGG